MTSDFRAALVGNKNKIKMWKFGCSHVHFDVLDEVEEVEHRCREMVEKIAEYTGEDIEQLLQR